MKICIVSPIYPVASNHHLGIFVHEQAKYLVQRGYDVHVITLGDTKDQDYHVKECVKVHRIKKGRLPILKDLSFAFSMLKELIRANKKINFDIIHYNFVGLQTLLICLASKLLNKPFVVTSHGIGLLARNNLQRTLTRFYLSFPLKIICVSNYVAKLASQYTKKSKIVVIKNGVDTEKLILTKSLSKFKKEINLKNEIILLSVGNLVERKGIDIVLSALPDVIKSYPSLKYFIIGAGPEKENLQKLIKGLNLRKHVVFAGDVDNKHLANFYNLCDIFVLMSRTIKEKAGIEGFGIVYIEASYFGKPVIGGKSGGTADAIVDGVTGYRIEPKNTEDLKNKLILLLKNEKLRKKLGQQGMKRVKNQFLWKHNVEKLVKVYGRLIE